MVREFQTAHFVIAIRVHPVRPRASCRPPTIDDASLRRHIVGEIASAKVQTRLRPAANWEEPSSAGEKCGHGGQNGLGLREPWFSPVGG